MSEQNPIEVLAELVHEAYQLFGWALAEEFNPDERREKIGKWMDRFVEEIASAESRTGIFLDLMLCQDKEKP